jgi:hypothetical protein
VNKGFEIQFKILVTYLLCEGPFYMAFPGDLLRCLNMEDWAGKLAPHAAAANQAFLEHHLNLAKLLAKFDLTYENKDLTTDFKRLVGGLLFSQSMYMLLAIPELAREKKEATKDPISKDWDEELQRFLVEVHCYKLDKSFAPFLERLQPVQAYSNFEVFPLIHPLDPGY